MLTALMRFPTMSASDNKVLRYGGVKSPSLQSGDCLRQISDQRRFLLRRALNSRAERASHCAIRPLCSTVKKAPIGTPVGRGGALTMGRLGASCEAVGRFYSRCSVCQNRFSADGATKTRCSKPICPPKQPRRLSLAKRCARPDRGCPGGSIRSMQGGWGAQHRSDIGSFIQVELGISVSTDIGVVSLGKGSKIF
jgi:hypothetical protein